MRHLVIPCWDSTCSWPPLPPRQCATWWYLAETRRVLDHRCLHGNTPPGDTLLRLDVFLTTAASTAMRHLVIPCWHSTSDIKSRRCLRSGSRSTLLVPSTRRATLGDRAFPVDAARTWNALPSSVRTSSTYLAFCPQLKTLLFKASFEDQTWLRYLFVALR